jgi:hypothetical protein
MPIFCPFLRQKTLLAQVLSGSVNERAARQNLKFPSVMLNQFTEQNVCCPE